MAKAEKKQTITEIAAKATTSEQLVVVVSRLEADLEAAENNLETLEGSRKDVVFSGKTLDEFHAELRDTQERIKTLSAGLEEARRRYDAALAKEMQENLVERTDAIKATEAPALQEAYRKLHDAMKVVLAVSQEVQAVAYAIESHNDLVERRGRRDLSVPIASLKSAVKIDLGMPSSRPTELERMEGESDDAFGLRKANAEHRAQRASELNDPIRELGVATMIAVQNVALDMGAHERERNFRLVSVQNYVAPDGQLVEKFIDADPAYKNKHHRAHFIGLPSEAGGVSSIIRGTAQAVA